MSREPSTSAWKGLRVLLEGGSTSGLTDAELVRRYADRKDEAAFGALVDRHGPMVWGVARRVLGDVHRAEDAFQATFLILARKANGVRVEGSLGRWLHGVALRVATRSRAEGLRRMARDARVVLKDQVEPTDPERAELLAALDEEMGRLPEKYRSPLVLCHLEGLTYAGAAEQLGCPADTVKARLAKGRELLRGRLGRRGLGLSASSVGGVFSMIAEARAGVPSSVAESTVRAVLTLARSASALSLAQGVIRSMFMIRTLKILAWAVPASASATAGLWLLAASPAVDPPRPAAPQAKPSTVVRVEDPSTAIAVPLPGRDDLHRLLRRAADEAIALATKEPRPAFGTLSNLAKAQALADDPIGAKSTFAVAFREAVGEFGGPASFEALLQMGNDQRQAGFLDDALVTFRKAAEAVPGVVHEFFRDQHAIRALGEITQAQAQLGAKDDARKTADRLRAFAKELVAGSKAINLEDTIADILAGALASVDDFDGAFRLAGKVQLQDMLLGQAAVEATKALDREASRRYVDEAIARAEKVEFASRTYTGMTSLALAQARLGDVEGAKRTIRTGFDPTQGQMPALDQIVGFQIQGGDLEGARATVREMARWLADPPFAPGPHERWAVLAKSQLRLGDLDGALRSVETIPEGQRSEILSRIARALAIAGRADDARKAIGRALQDARDKPVVVDPPAPKPPTDGLGFSVKYTVFRDGVEISPYTSGEAARSGLAKIQAMAGDTPEALKTLSTVQQDHRRYVLENIVAARTTAGDLTGALDLATREARTLDERRLVLHAIGSGVVTRLGLESPARAEE